MIAYIDTVSTAAPTHGAEPWRAHCIRVAIAIEDDRKIVSTLLALVTPPEGVAIDRDWCRRYGVADNLPGDEGERADYVAYPLSKLIAGAVCVCQNKAFHRDVIAGLFTDADIEPPALGGWFCLQQEARTIVDARTVQGKPKVPNLGESYRHFTGETLPLIATLGWREAALVQLNAIRAVHWGLLKYCLPPDRIETQQ